MKTLKNKIFSLIDSGSLLQIILFTSLIAIGGSVWAQTAVNPANGHTYELLKGCGTWVQCEAAAVQKGGHLVTIRSQAENDWIASTFNVASTTNGYWIGLTDQDVEGTWQWISGEPVIYMK
ncbi:MAG: lectin-like protein, partial [Rhizobiaceae bacterium]